MKPGVLVAWLILCGGVSLNQRVAAQFSSVSAQQSASRLAGTVVTDTPAPVPVARAVVSVRGSALPAALSVIADDEGRFAFSALPAGRYAIRAEKPAYITGEYGAKRPGRPGVEVSLDRDMTLDGLTIRLARGAVVAGTLRDMRGAPLGSVEVRAISLKRGSRDGHHLSLTNNGTRTNQLGEYRIYGLEPGPYLVRTGALIAGGGMLAGREERIDSLLAWLANPLNRVAPSTTDVVADSQAVTYVPVYYPGTPDPGLAAVVNLASAEERLGLDFSVQPVPAATVSGTVVLENGQPAAGATVFLKRPAAGSELALPVPAAVTAGRDGQFRISDATPGHYRLFARLRTTKPAQSDVVVEADSTVSEARWASTEIVVTGTDVNGVRLSIGAGVRLAGRLMFDSATNAPAPDVSGVSVVLRSDRWGLVTAAGVGRDGSFVLSGPPAGSYRLELAGQLSGTWVPVTATVGGVDLLDMETDFREGQLETVVVRLTDNPAQLSGRLVTVDERPVSDVFIVLFSEDTSFWRPDSRRIRAVRPATDGAFLLSGLAPGPYCVAVLTDIDAGEWWQPEILEAVRSAAVRVDIKAGTKHAQDLVVGRAPLRPR